jgi:putative addiction module CopG family antidote
MEIRLRPELEALIREDVERGGYQTVSEFVEHAVAILHEQEAWLAEHRKEIERQIASGYEGRAARRTHWRGGSSFTVDAVESEQDSMR